MVMEEMTFRNLLVVKSHLNSIGYRVSKSTLYEHAKSRKIKPRENGLFYITDVEQYDRDYLKKKNEPVKESSDAVQHRRNEAEARKLEAQAKHWEIKAKIETGNYVPREEFEHALTKRALLFKSDGENFFRSGVEKTIALVGGNMAKASELIEYQLDALYDWLDRYAQPGEFKVPTPSPLISDNDEDSETISGK